MFELDLSKLYIDVSPPCMPVYSNFDCWHLTETKCEIRARTAESMILFGNLASAFLMVFMGAVPIIKKGKRPEVIPNTFLTMPT